MGNTPRGDAGMKESTKVGKNSVEQFKQNGYTLAKGLFSQEEVAHYRDHYMTLRAAGSYPGDTAGVDVTSNDPLKRYPRMIHMHRWDETSLQWLLDERINHWLTSLTG